MKKAGTLLLAGLLLAVTSFPQVWNPDNGDGTYTNPIIHADYSDPDAIRVGDSYYMTSSSFNASPGLPILHSKDLVNWELIGHALQKQVPIDHFNKVQHGAGVWAPAIRYHKNEFWIYYPDPDFGIYLVKAKNPKGPWSDPILVQGGKGLIDPCPLWDDDGKVYLVHAYANSRAGIKSIIVVKELNKEGTKIISDSVRVYDGRVDDPTIEGPKFYKRNNYYYIFAPAGGVKTGWQTVLRSRNVYGPYERRVVMDQGKTAINGPHQGAWVQTNNGEDWFIHFQDKDAYGRIVHLQPMKWVNDWPVIGNDADGDGKGEPVLIHKKPNTGAISFGSVPTTNDEFNSPSLQQIWQWQANPLKKWAIPNTNEGLLRLRAIYYPDSLQSIWNLPSMLTQKFPAETFSATVKLKFKFKQENERFGLTVFGLDYAIISIRKKGSQSLISFSDCMKADKQGRENESIISNIEGKDLYLRVMVLAGGKCSFSYSIDGINFNLVNKEPFIAKPGKWVGAKLGLLCTSPVNSNSSGYVDVDWFRVEKITIN